MESGVLLGQVESKKLISHPSGDVKQESGHMLGAGRSRGNYLRKEEPIPSDVTAGWEPAPLLGSPFLFVKTRVPRSLGVLSCRQVRCRPLAFKFSEQQERAGLRQLGRKTRKRYKTRRQ